MAAYSSPSFTHRLKLTGLFLVPFLLSLSTLFIGDTPWNEVWENLILRLQGSSETWNPLLDERLPRLIVLLATGASLAASGAVMQALFQNPLASPSILGVSVGGSLFVLPVFYYQLYAINPFAIPLAAFCGCFFTLIFVYALARRNGQVGMDLLILTGIAVSTLFLAVQGALLYAMRNHWQLVQLFTEWESGSSSGRTWDHVHMQLPLTLVGLTGCFVYRNELNLLCLGEEEAANLGVDVEKVRWRLFLCVALLTGGTLAGIGIVPFLGLVLPHILRNLAGADCRRLIPLTILTGALSLAFIDLSLRLFNIRAFTIGNVTAMIGGSFFLCLLFKKGRSC